MPDVVIVRVAVAGIRRNRLSSSVSSYLNAIFSKSGDAVEKLTRRGCLDENRELGRVKRCLSGRLIVTGLLPCNSEWQLEFSEEHPCPGARCHNNLSAAKASIFRFHTRYIHVPYDSDCRNVFPDFRTVALSQSQLGRNAGSSMEKTGILLPKNVHAV